MSRETDNSSSGPQGRGHAAYPPGMTPYGTPAQGAAAEGADAERQAAEEPSTRTAPGTGGTQAQERKTETTLTTRVRINIPGSRPIPPVVMRTPMSDLNARDRAADPTRAPSTTTGPTAAGPTTAGGGAAGGARSAAADAASREGPSGVGTGTGLGAAAGAGLGAGSGPRSGPGAGSAPAGPAGGAGSGTGGAPAQERTSDWFAPPKRKAGGARGGAGAAGAGFPTGSTAPGDSGVPGGASGAAFGPGPGLGGGPDVDTGGGFDSGAGFDSGTGFAPGTGFDAGTGTGGGFDTGSAPGTGFDTGFDTGPRPGAGSAAGFDSGAGLGTGFGTGTGATGAGVDSGSGSGLASGSGSGSGAGDPAAGAGSTTASGLPIRGTDHGQGAFGATGDAFADYTESEDRSGYGQFAEHPGPGIGPTADTPSGTGYPTVPGTSGSAVPPAIPTPGGIDPAGTDMPGEGRSGLYDLFEDSAPPSGGSASGLGAPGRAGAHGRHGRHGAHGTPGADETPGGPGSGPSTGAFDVTAALAAGPLGASRGPRDSDLAYFSQNRGSEPPPGPSGPTGGPVTGDSVLPTRHRKVPGADPVGHPPLDGDHVGPPPRMSDDTAILTPQKPAPDPTAPEDNVSGHTVASGIPVVPAAAQRSPFDASGAPAEPAETAMTHTPPKLPDGNKRGTPAPQPKKKGGNKLVLPVVALVLVAGGAYGAGLLVNHSDVPKGTTVLGVDIGGGTRDDAAKKLDAAFGKRTVMPLQLSVDGHTVQLRPDQAGLALDNDATVRAAAHNDYNPVSVIGSLFGGTRVIQPVMPVDEEKLRAALEHASGGAGSVTEGTIRFEPGKAVAVHGKAGKGIDASGSATTVEEAYRVQVEKGHTDPVQVPLTESRPTISNAEVDRMMKAFAKPAMSANVTITAGDRSIEFGPNKSLPQILGVKAINGKLVDTYDRAAVQRLYGSTFDGILITRANGKKTPVQPEDVLGVMRKALLGKTPAERVGVIELDPS